MKYIRCDNSKAGGKYWTGKICNEDVLVDDNTVKVICWKCIAFLTPVEEKKKKTGYPPGWKFMNFFVDKDGNVFHKGVEQTDLKGTLPVTELKERKQRKKKEDTLEKLVMAEFNKRIQLKKDKKKIRKKEVEVPVIVNPTVATVKSKKITTKEKSIKPKVNQTSKPKSKLKVKTKVKKKSAETIKPTVKKKGRKL